MEELKICALEKCLKTFISKRKNQTYCSKKCSLEARNILKKNKYPWIRCPNCGQLSRLDFEPLKSLKKLFLWKCGFCSYQKPLKEYLEIQKIKKEFKQRIQVQQKKDKAP